MVMSSTRAATGERWSSWTYMHMDMDMDMDMDMYGGLLNFGSTPFYVVWFSVAHTERGERVTM